MGVQGGELSSNTGRRLGGTAEAVNPWKLFPPFSAKSLAFGRRCLQSHCWGVNMGSNKHGNPHCLSSWRMLCNNDASNATGEGIRSGTSERIRRWPLAESPPRTPQKEYWREAHGVAWCDLYQWLENAEDFEVMRHVNKENDYTDRVMKGTQRLQHALVREMMQRMPRSEVTPPEPWGEWAYWVAVPEGKEYPVYFRRRQRNVERKSTWSVWMNWIPNDACGDSAEIILDQNALADEFGYCHIGMCKISRDHTQMVYTLDGSGDERFTAYVKDLRTNRIHEEHVIVDVVSAEWAADGSCLFYTTCDHLQRAFRVYRRSLLPMGRTRTGGQDELLLEETDPAWFVDVSRTKDWRFITIYSSSKTSSKAYVVDASQPLASSMSLVRPAASGVRYFVEHHDDWLYILTNSPGHGIQSKDAGEQGTNKTLLQEFRLVKSKASQLGKDSSEEEVVPVPSELCIVDFDVFNGHCILYGRRNALPSIAVGSLHSDASATRDPITQSVDGTTEGNVQWQTVPLPEGVCSIVPGANQDFFATTLRFTVSSPNMPERTYDYDLTSGGLHLLQQNEVNLTDCVRSSPGSAALGNSKIELGAAAKEEDTPWSRYTCRQVLVSSSGKTGVPLTLVHQKSFEPKGQNPALIIGYGAYGEPVEVQWCSDRLSLLDRGWVIALAHVRGGGELGQTWHRAGMLERKPVSFADFVACAEWLPKHGYAHSEQLCGWGISAGGLLLGAAVNLRPELFRAVVMKVPFVDICNTMLNAELPLTAHEYDEWGNPKEPSVFHRLRSYSPYDNIRRLPYPAMLVTSSFNDSRVGYWEAMKWVAAVREHTSAKADVSPILLKVSLDAGHFGEGGRYSCLEETALEYAFLLQNVEHGMP